MRPALLLTIAILLGCERVRVDDEWILDMQHCTLSSRLAAILNCSDSSLSCKWSVLEPDGCSSTERIATRERTASEIAGEAPKLP
jgi:hypothetical protein